MRNWYAVINAEIHNGLMFIISYLKTMMASRNAYTVRIRKFVENRINSFVLYERLLLCYFWFASFLVAGNKGGPHISSFCFEGTKSIFVL